MGNWDIEHARRYHESTKHPGMPPHFLDWENQPIPFKIYKDLPPLDLPTFHPPSDCPTNTALRGPLSARKGTQIDAALLGRILFLTAGITKRATYPGGTILFRAAPCTGALYHVDLYVACTSIAGLEAGLYHFSPQDFSLRWLRGGDVRGHLARAAQCSLIARAPVSVVFASTYWRNAWKYQARAYRHVFWDGGTMAANMLAACNAHGTEAELVLAFVDREVERLLGLKRGKEGAFVIVTIGGDGQEAAPAEGEVEPIDHPTIPLSAREVDYPAIELMHEASSLATPDDVRRFRPGAPLERRTPPAEGRTFELHPSERDGERFLTLERTVLRRGSTRRFRREPIGGRDLADVLHCSIHPLPWDVTPEGTLFNDVYLIVNAVEGLPPGAYYLRTEQGRLELLKEGEFRQEAHWLALDQELGGDASVDVYFMASLDEVLAAYGNRGYRAAQFEAGVLGGRLYLAAYALGLGATGLTFFDDEVTRFFSPHAEGKSPMFLVALGRSALARTGSVG